MKIGIISDIHGNLLALDATLKALVDTDRIICLGDVVNYGPWSNECVDLLKTIKDIVLIKGNHEEYFLTKKYDGTNEVAQAFFRFCIADFKKENDIQTYIDFHDNWNMRFTHTVDNQYIFPDSTIKLDRNYVIGHSHHAFKLENNGFILINPGSVGQNRKYINAINYAIYDTDKNTFEFKTILYNIQTFINELMIRNYPTICINYYANKARL